VYGSANNKEKGESMTNGGIWPPDTAR